MSFANPSAPSRLTLPLTFLAAFLVLALCTRAAWIDLGRPTLGIDDANIFFVYARHLAHGHGIVYNHPGEHVEGASSLLFLLLCTLVWHLASHPELTIFALNFLFVLFANAALLYLLHRLARRLHAPTPIALALPAVYLLWIALSPSYFDWCLVSLMDTGLYSLLLVLSFTALALPLLQPTPLTLHRALPAALLVAALILVRPEGLAWGLLFAALFVWLHPRRKPLALLPAAAYLVTAAALTAFRRLYFGYPLPNTFYAKVSSSRWDTLRDGLAGLHDLLGFYGSFLLLPTAVLLVTLLFARRLRLPAPFPRLLTLTLSFLLLGMLIPVLEGGDNFHGFRQFQSLFPLLAFAAALPVLPLLARGRRRAALSVLALLTLPFVLTTHSTWRQFRLGNRVFASIYLETPSSNRLNYDLAFGQRQNGDRLRAIFAGTPLPTLGIAAAGAVAYAYDGPVDDLMGLNDTRMAHASSLKANDAPKGHQSFNPTVFYAHPPQLLLPRAQTAAQPFSLPQIGLQNLGEDDFENEIFASIFNQPRFWNTFTLAALRRNAQPNLLCIGYFRRDFLAQLLRTGAFTELASWQPPPSQLSP